MPLPDAQAVPTAAPVAEPATVEPQALTPEQEDAAYEAEFNAAVAKREAEKNGEDPPVAEPAPAPAQAAAPAAADEQKPDVPAVDPLADVLALVPEDKRDALQQRLRAAEEAEARARKLELDNRSMAGRMAAYQRRYEEAAGKRPEAVRQQATAEQSEEWQQFAQDYPDIAKAIEARVPQGTAGVAPELVDVVEFVEQEKRNRFLHDAWEAVESVHAGWRDVARSKEFQAWKATSPTYEKLASSDDVADAIALFDLYKATTARGAPTADPTQAAEAAKLAARRGAQAEGARTPTNRASSPNQSVDLNDEDQLFAFYAQKSNARIKSRYAP